MQIVSLKVRNHTIIKSWRQGRTIQFLLSALSEKNWGAKHFFQPMIKTSIKHIIYFNCIHPSLLMCCWLGSIGLWILGLGEGLGFWLDCLYCETGRDHFLIFWWSYWHFRIATIAISNWDSQHFFNFSPSRYPRYPRCTDWDLIWHWWSLCDTNVDLLMILILLTLFSIWC